MLMESLEWPWRRWMAGRPVEMLGVVKMRDLKLNQVEMLTADQNGLEQQ